MDNKIIFYGIFYVLLTAFFIYIFIREKKLGEKIAVYKNNFSEKIISLFNIKNEGIKKILKKMIHYTETIGTALVLVLVIQRFYIGNFKIPTGSMIPTIEIGDRVFANMVKYKFFAPERDEIIVFKEPIQDKVLYTKRAIGLPGEKIRIENNKLYINDVEFKNRDYSNLGIDNQEWIVPKKGDKLKIIPAGNYRKAYENYNIDIEKIQSDLAKNTSAVKEILPNLRFVLNGYDTGMILDFIHDKKIINDILDGKTIELTLTENYYLALGDNTNHSFDSRMWGFVAEHRIRGKAVFRFWPLNRIGLVK